MYVSPDVISVIIGGATLVAAIFGGMYVLFLRFEARINSRVDERMESSEANVNARFDQVDKRFEQIDDRFDKVDDRFDKVDDELRGMRHDIVDLQIAVARLEGPQPTLIRAR